MSGPVIPKWTRVRLMVGMLLLTLLFGVVGWKGYRLQTVEGPRLRELAEQQYLKKIKLPPRRGTILDRHNTPLAISVDVDSVFANPRMVGSRAAVVARELSSVLGLNMRTLQKRLSNKRYFSWLKRRVTPREARQVQQLKIRGVGLTQESRRFYPNKGLGGSVVGFAGMDGRGLEGIELSLDTWLKGSPIQVSGLRDALGRSVFSKGTHETDGHNVQLSLDKLIQFEVEQALAEAYKTVRRRTGWVATVVMDPSTGDILAMASAPSFNPNKYNKAKPWQWRNRALTDAFEPGSTLKVFSVGSALEAGIIRPDEVFHCEGGAWRVGHFTIHDSHGYGRLSVAEIIKKSSNIGSAKIAFRLGKERLYKGLKSLGFGRRTGIQLRGERTGILRSPKRWSKIGLSNIAFGQGMTATVIQLAQALTAVANDGKMMRPRLVQKITNAKGETVEYFAPRGERVFSTKTAQTMRKMMAAVAGPEGTAPDAALERFTVAGKTGTAQKVDPVTKAYSSDLWVSSFIGMVPASRPRLVIAVVVNEPDGKKYYGGQVAGPIFKRIAEKAMAYLGIRPDKRASLAKKKKAAQKDESAARAMEGYIIRNRNPAPPLPGKSRAVGKQRIPDFTGMSIVEVLEKARKLGLRVELKGSGRAVGQSPGPGRAAVGTPCRVSFRPPG